MREAVLIETIKRLLEEGAQATAYDPDAVPNAKTIFGEQMRYAPSPEECIKALTAA